MDPLEWFDQNESKLRGAALKYMKKLAHRDSQDAISLPKTGNSNTKKVESRFLMSTSDISVSIMLCTVRLQSIVQYHKQP